MKKKFTGNTRLFLIISGAIVAVALIMQIAGVGLNLGIDFTGGSLLNYSVGESYSTDDVETILASAGFEGSQVNKAAPSAASIALQAEIAAGEEAPAAQADETQADETQADETQAEEGEAAAQEEPVETVLNLDKSGIADDGLTDLQIRLNLADSSAGLEAAIAAAVKEVLPDAEQTHYGALLNSTIVEKALDATFSGGYIAEFTVGSAFESADVAAALEKALAEGYSVLNLSAVRYDAEAEAEAPAEEETEAPAGEEAEAPAEEEAEAPAEEEAEAPAEEEAEAPAEEEEAAVEESGTDLRVMVKIDDEAARVRALLEEQMVAKYPNFRFVSIDHVSAIAGRDLLSNAVKALLIAFACMLIYIAIRFDVFSGLAALFGLMHDVLIMCAIMVFFRFAFQVNSSFIAAVLTIVGYSINNTIIVFDRIRETSKKPGWSQKSRVEIVENSVANTLSRTINTSLTTLVTLVVLYIFGVESIREFAFPLIIGMLAGTYSSVLLSGQVWAMWMDKRAARAAAKKA